MRKVAKYRYQMGGWGMQGGSSWQGAGNTAAGIGQFGVQLWDQLAPPDASGVDKNAVGKGALSGAASGAAAGTAIMPGWGTAIGAVVGGVSGAIGGNRANKQAEAALRAAQQARYQTLINAGNARLATYDMTGGQEGESIYALGGKLKTINSNTVEVEGNSHAEGGVNLGQGAEVEDNETIAGDFVFSDYLGFADRHKTIANQIGKIEKKPLNRERRVTLEILRKKENALANEQETLKQELGIGSEATMQMGGELPLRDFLTQPYSLDEWKGVKTPPTRDWSKYPLTAEEIRGWTKEIKGRQLATDNKRMDELFPRSLSSTLLNPITSHQRNSLTTGNALTEPQGTPSLLTRLNR